mmetsp:Transcript_6158/g.22640  ORF Transcript_6158/g.22640 Transcript_6158/m.22640 type:complete len:284 (+) Transcript_6158:100-951(+)
MGAVQEAWQQATDETVAAAAAAAMSRYFGHTSFRGQQLPAISAALRGRDVLCVMPTGSGKSMVFTLPPLVRPPGVAGDIVTVLPRQLALVISPLIALMESQVAALRERGIAASLLNSHQTTEQRTEVQTALRRLTETDEDAAPAPDKMMKAPPWSADDKDKSISLLFLTPEMAASPSFQQMGRRLHQCNRICLVAIDEAHCVSEWGHSFRPDYLQLSKSFSFCRPHVPFVALTATATPKVREQIAAALGLRNHRVLHTPFDRPNIFYEVRYAVKNGNHSQWRH